MEAFARILPAKFVYAPSDLAALETVSFWRTRLTQELANGQLRSEIVYLFGALLEEWTHYNAAFPPARPENSEQRRTLMTPIMQNTPINLDTTVLDPFFSTLQSVDAQFEMIMHHLLAENNDPLIQLDELHQVAAAQKLGRKWIGIDITHLSIALQKYRLESMFPDITFKVIGEPQETGSARWLAQENRYQFQWWALSLIRARPFAGQDGNKESGKGIDGVTTFIDDMSGKAKRALVQVKSGHVNSSHIRDLRGMLQREQAAIGVFITLENPTYDMLTEASNSGFYHSPGWNKDYPCVQILTIEELLCGAEVKMPPQFGTFKTVQRVQPISAESPE